MRVNIKPAETVGLIIRRENFLLAIKNNDAYVKVYVVHVPNPTRRSLVSYPCITRFPHPKSSVCSISMMTISVVSHISINP